MTLFGSFQREVSEARAATAEAEGPDVIRVTTNALRGSIVTVLCRYDHDEGPQDVRELRVHPEDWRDLLVETDALGAYGVGGDPTVVLGVPVVHG